MLLSIWPSLQQPWSDVVEVAAHADATGWHGVYVADHFMGVDDVPGERVTPTMEVLAALGGLAGVTERARLGSLVLGMTYRHPAVLANWAATFDVVSGGRLVLGIGAGWQENEHAAYGLRLGPPGERLRRFDEGTRALLGLMRQERTSLDGEFFQLADALCDPKPHQRPVPLLVGGSGDRMMRLIARHADQWNIWSLPPRFAERSAELDRACEEVGRDPGAIHRSTQALVKVTGDAAEIAAWEAQTRPSLAGPPERIAEVVAAWAELGVDEVIVPDGPLGRGSARLEVMDALKEAVDAVAASASSAS